jgi:predicted dehydrogenase
MAASGAPAAAENKRIRVAVFGTVHGHARSKIRALRALPEYEFVGICRPDPDQPDHGDVLEGVRWLSLEEILQDSSIELVAVESRIEYNLQYAQKFVNAGKFVHLDKPPGMQAAIEAARNGWLGQVYAMRANIDKPTAPEERRQLARFRGGMMFEDGCHLIDRAVALFGKPRKVTGFLKHDSPLPDGLADNTLAVLEYDRALAEISVAAFQPHGNQYRCLEILGANGKATVQPFAPARLMLDLKESAGPYKAGTQMLEPAMPPGPTYAPDFREMAHIIRDGAKPSYSPEHDLIAQQALLEACGIT